MKFEELYDWYIIPPIYRVDERAEGLPKKCCRTTQNESSKKKEADYAPTQKMTVPDRFRPVYFVDERAEGLEGLGW